MPDTQNVPQHPTALSTVLTPVNRAGYPFIAAGVVLTLILLLAWVPAGLLAGLITAWIVYFFRDPPRFVPQDKGLILSPADGVVQMIENAAPPPEIAGEGDHRPRTRISIFLNIFDVHVNRIPAEGVVKRVVYTPGKFFNAALDKASTDNERTAFTLGLEDGREIICCQIAGLVARRIICRLEDGQKVEAGKRFGLIRFGSRVDIYLPDGAVPRVAVGQKALGGETVLADLADERPQPDVRQI